jgi:hypothetical protein
MKKTHLSLVSKILSDNIQDILSNIKKGIFKHFDTTLGDTHCQNRALMITSIYPKLHNMINTDGYVLLNERIEQHLKLFIDIDRSDLSSEYYKNIIDQYYNDYEYHLLNLALLYILNPINVKDHLYGVLIQDKTKKIEPFNDTLIKKIKNFLINASAYYIKNLLYHLDQDPIFYKDNLPYLRFCETVEKILDSQDVIVINSMFITVGDRHLIYHGLEVVMMRKGIILDEDASFSMEKESPYIVFTGYSINNKKDHRYKLEILESAKMHPRFPKDEECKSDTKLYKKDKSIALEDTKFRVCHVASLGGGEIIEMVNELKILPKFPFDRHDIASYLEPHKKSEDRILELANKIQAPEYLPLLGDEYITQYLVNNHIQASLVDFGHGEYPWQPHEYNRIQSNAA